MAGEFKSSFIPKEPIVKKGPSRSHEGNFVSFITTILFVIVLASAGGVFAYDKYLESRLQSKIDELSKIEREFDVDLIEELVRLDNRLRVSDDILNSHIATSNIFEELQRITSQSVRFTSFSYNFTENGERVSLRGIAQSFGAVAHQADVVGNHRMFNDVIFSDLAIDAVGNVTFRLSAAVNPSFTRYRVSD